jgi:hypothetical protein
LAFAAVVLTQLNWDYSPYTITAFFVIIIILGIILIIWKKNE